MPDCVIKASVVARECACQTGPDEGYFVLSPTRLPAISLFTFRGSFGRGGWLVLRTACASISYN